MTAVIRACVAGAMAGVVLVTTCAVTGPSVAAAQQAVPPPATNAPQPPAAPVPAEVQPVQPPPVAAPTPVTVPPAEVAPPVPTEAAAPPPEGPAPGSTYVVAPPDTGLPAAPEPTNIEPAPQPASKLPSYVLWGTGAASLIVGAVFGGMALSAKKDFDDNPSYDRADTVDHRALVADVAFGLGIVLAITGTVFFCAHGANDEQTPQQAQNARDHKLQLSVAPLVSPRAGGGALQVRF